LHDANRRWKRGCRRADVLGTASGFICATDVERDEIGQQCERGLAQNLTYMDVQR
jgi:hypothetical protein